LGRPHFLDLSTGYNLSYEWATRHLDFLVCTYNASRKAREDARDLVRARKCTSLINATTSLRELTAGRRHDKVTAAIATDATYIRLVLVLDRFAERLLDLQTTKQAFKLESNTLGE
jgi:hypothetical protein